MRGVLVATLVGVALLACGAAMGVALAAGDKTLLYTAWSASTLAFLLLLRLGERADMLELRLRQCNESRERLYDELARCEVRMFNRLMKKEAK